jgi:hypothetical protein
VPLKTNIVWHRLNDIKLFSEFEKVIRSSLQIPPSMTKIFIFDDGLRPIGQDNYKALAALSNPTLLIYGNLSMMFQSYAIPPQVRITVLLLQ